jgi:hypothetical protein
MRSRVDVFRLLSNMAVPFSSNTVLNDPLSIAAGGRISRAGRLGSAPTYFKFLAQVTEPQVLVNARDDEAGPKGNSTIRVPETFAKVVAPIRRKGRQIARLAQKFLVCRIRLVQIYNIGNGYAMLIPGQHLY